MKLWIARDNETNELWGYLEKPIRATDAEVFEPRDLMFDIDDDLFPEITWENSPVEFTGEIKEEQHDDK